jgi:hypothetical protein
MTRISLLLFALLLAAAELVAQPYDLRYALKEGKTLKYKKLESLKSVAQTVRGLYADIDKNAETFLTVTAEKSEGGDLSFVYLQDTVYTEDKSASGAKAPKSFDFQNAISKKPIRVRMSAKGDLRNAAPLSPLELPAGVPVSERMLARQAAIFPALPQRSLKVGDRWTDAARDTTYPKQKDPRYGEGAGTRFTAITTAYTVDSLVKHNGHSCLKISWKSSVSIEGKMLFPKADSFNEETSAVSGTLYFAAKEGLLVELSVRTEKEATSAMFSLESEVIPITSSTETRLLLLPS